MLEKMPPGSGAETVRRRSPRRKHFLIGSGVALAALTATLTVGFLATSGSVKFTPTLTSSNKNLVYTGTSLANWTGTPFGASGATTPTWESGGTTTKTAPTWTLAVLANGDVKTGGDIAMVNASTATTTAPIVISVFLANAGAYSKDVTTYDLPVELACSTITVTSTKFSAWGTWTWSTGEALTVTTDQTFLTSNSPSLSWSVPRAADKFCEVSLGGVGTSLATVIHGALYLASTTTTTGSYSPQFYVTAQRS